MDVKVISAPVVNVKVTSSINSFMTERRFDRSLTIGDLKFRLEMLTGGSAGSMILTVYDVNDEVVCTLDKDSSLLGSYPVEENYRIHVVDCSKKAGEFEDLSKVEKYELSEEEYAKKSGTVREFLLKNKLGKFNEEEQNRILEESQRAEKAEEEKALSIELGSRCQVRVQAEPTRRGTVKFVGKTHFKRGWWVGVQFDEPLGKNDGSVGGKSYFTCPSKYGGFVRPANIEVGDYPEIMDDLEEM